MKLWVVRGIIGNLTNLRIYVSFFCDTFRVSHHFSCPKPWELTFQVGKHEAMKVLPEGSEVRIKSRKNMIWYRDVLLGGEMQIYVPIVALVGRHCNCFLHQASHQAMILIKTRHPDTQSRPRSFRSGSGDQGWRGWKWVRWRNNNSWIEWFSKGMTSYPLVMGLRNRSQTSRIPCFNNQDGKMAMDPCKWMKHRDVVQRKLLQGG